MIATLDCPSLDPQRLVELAQKGSTRALSRLFKHELHPRRIAVVKTRLTRGTFRILLESVEGVEPEQVFPWLCRVLANANIKAVERVKVYTRRIGSEQVDWIRILDLHGQNELQAIEAPQNIETINFLKKVEFPARNVASDA